MFKIDYFSFVLMFSFYSGVISSTKVFNSKDSKCVSVSLSEKQLNKIEELSTHLDIFLNQNLEKGHRSLEKVMSVLGEDKIHRLKVDRDDPLESYVLQYQIAMHRELKQMFKVMQTFITGAKGPNDVSISSSQNNKSLKDSKHDGFKSLPFYTPTDSQFRPADCSELLVSGFTKNGIYEVFPYKCHCTGPVKVYCDMEQDGGGWTVFLARKNVSKPMNFTRNWQAYKDGFGNPEKEYWMGNEALHTLTYNRNYVLRLEAEDDEGRQIWGEWKSFKVDSELNKYKLMVTSFNARSTAFDRFSYVNNNFFTTYDFDNDKHAKLNCAQSNKGGWWYNACHNNNPTGQHGKKDVEGIRIKPWSRVDKTIRFAKRVQLKIRPTICSETISNAQFNTHNCAILN